jgi:hypothetical protein
MPFERFLDERLFQPYLSEQAVKQLTSRQTPAELKDSYGLGFGVSPNSFGHGGAYSTNTSVV